MKKIKGTTPSEQIKTWSDDPAARDAAKDNWPKPAPGVSERLKEYHADPESYQQKRERQRRG